MFVGLRMCYYDFKISYIIRWRVFKKFIVLEAYDTNNLVTICPHPKWSPFEGASREKCQD